MSESVYAFRGETLARLIQRDQTAERIANFLKTNISSLPQELQAEAKTLVADRDGETNIQWGPRRLEQ